MNNIVSIKNLTISFKNNTQVVNDVNLEIPKGKTVAIVGESGSGKTLSALSILRLLPSGAKIDQGQIIFDRKDLLKLPLKEIEKIRGNRISTIFQEPMSSLNPLHKIDKQIKEVITTHKEISSQELNQTVLTLLKEVNLEDLVTRPNIYSYELSGGQRQRVMIAIALSCNPKLLIADEPTTALDVTIEAEILNLIQELKSELNMSMLMITHDLGVIGEVTDEVAVMYVGKVVERTSTKKLFSEPLHPYTKALFKSRPRINSSERLSSIDGTVPSPYSQTKGCSFAPRCEVAMDICKNKSPELIDLGEHHVSCWKYNKEEI